MALPQALPFPEWAKGFWRFGEFIQLNPVYAPFVVTAKANTTTVFDVYPTNGRVWYIGQIHLISNANTSITQKLKCFGAESLNQIYPVHPPGKDSWDYTPPRWNIRDDYGIPLRVEQLEFLLENTSSADEDNTIEIYGYETWDLLGSPSAVIQLYNSGDVVDPNITWFKIPLTQTEVTYPEALEVISGVKLSTKPIGTIGSATPEKTVEKVKVLRPKYCPETMGIEFTMFWIPNPDYTQCIAKVEAIPDVVNTIRSDPECQELTLEQAKYIIEKEWYPGYMFDPNQFLLRKLPKVYGIWVTMLKDMLTGAPISYNGIPARIELPTGLKCIIKLYTLT